MQRRQGQRNVRKSLSDRRSNQLPSLETDPIDWPCREEEYQSLFEETDLAKRKLQYSYDQLHSEMTTTQTKKQQISREKVVIQGQLTICQDQVDKLIQNIEDVTNNRPACQNITCPPADPCPPSAAPVPCPTTRPITTRTTTPATTVIPVTCPTTSTSVRIIKQPCPTTIRPIITTPCPSCTTRAPLTCPPSTTRRPKPCPTHPTCPTCPVCPTYPTISPKPLPTCRTCPSCPTPPMMPRISQQVHHVDRNFTTKPTRRLRELPTDWITTPQPTQYLNSTEAPKYELYNLLSGEWHSDVPTGAVHFVEDGYVAGDVDYVHLIYDFDIKKYMDQGKEFCSKTIAADLRRLKHSSKKIYEVLYHNYATKCDRIVDQLHDTFDTYVSGSHSYMYHAFHKQKNPLHHQEEAYVEDENDANILLSTRDKRQFLIIGGLLLAAGVIAGMAWLYNHASLLSMSFGSWTNPATIRVLNNHEKRLNIDEQDIATLKESVQKLIDAENKMEEDIHELQLLHRTEGLLEKLQWEFHTLAQGLEKLRNGQLSSFLIKPQALQIILKQFRERLNVIGAHTILSDLNEIYMCDTSYLVFNNLTIRAFVHVPIYKPDSLMTIYKYQGLPTKVGSKLLTYLPEFKFLAVNNLKNKFRPMTWEMLNECKQLKHIRYCKSENYYHLENHKSCIRSLYAGKEHEIVSYCQVKIGPIQDQMVRLNFETLLLFHSSAKRAKITCPMSKPPQDEITFSGFKRIRLFPGCRLTTNDFMADGVTNTYSTPHEIHIMVPDVEQINEFKALQQHLNLSSKSLDSIQSQKNLRIADINALFADEQWERTLTLSIIGGILGFVGIIFACCVWFKCVWSCLRKQRPRTRSNRNDNDIPLQERNSSRRSYRNPARTMNILYPRPDQQR